MGNRSLAEVLDEMGYVERTKLHDVRLETARETAIKVNKEVTEDVTKNGKRNVQ